jgi:hypothetical protein
MNSEPAPGKIKIVGRRLRQPGTPAENYARAAILQRQADLLNPFPKPRGFVYRARTWEDLDRWRNAQENPRLRRRP